MENLQEFLDMGGYGAYIWSAYSVAALIIAGMVAISLRSLRRAQKTLSSLKNISE